MNVDSWQIWHSYVTYLHDEIDIPVVARRLVEDGTCALTYMPNGQVILKNDEDTTISLSLKFRRHPHVASASIVIPEELSSKPYLADCAGLAVRMDMHEQHLRSDAPGDHYVRGFLTEQRLEYDDWSATVYPTYKLHANGVVITYLRIYSPNDSCPVDSFINRFVNIGHLLAKDVLLDPVTCRTEVESFLNKASSSGLVNRFRRARRSHRLQQVIETLQFTDSSGDFPFSLVRLSDVLRSLGISPMGAKWDLRNLAEHVHALILRSVSKMTKSPEWGRNRVGMPIVHLLGFSDQPDRVHTYTEDQLDGFAKILARSSVRHSSMTQALSPDLRPIEDYSMYLSRAAMLFVAGNSHLEAMRHDGHISETAQGTDWAVYDKQIIAELALLLRGSLMRSDGRSKDRRWSVSSLRDDELELIDYERMFVEVSKFDEVNDVLRRTVAIFGLDKIQNRIRQNLQIRAIQLAEHQQRSTTLFGSSLTVLLGLLGVPALSENVVAPVWRLNDWYEPDDPNVAQLLLLGVSAGLLLAGVAVVWAIVRWHRRQSRRYEP